jgi:hypothetical protein
LSDESILTHRRSRPQQAGDLANAACWLIIFGTVLAVLASSNANGLLREAFIAAQQQGQNCERCRVDVHTSA